MNLPIPIISVVVGAIILLFGRKLFWLLVAAIGFAAGVEVAPHFVHEASPIISLSFALVLGFVGALLAMFLQKLAIGVAGFLAGGRLALAIAAAFFVHHEGSSTIVFVIGGIVGAILLLIFFDWALIAVSSMVGAYLIESAFILPPAGTTILFLALTVIGILLQAGMVRPPVRAD